MKQTLIYSQENWFWAKYDGRKKEFRGISKAQFREAQDKHILRYGDYRRTDDYQEARRRRREMIAYFAEIPYRYEGDGEDDFNKFQRPSRDGVGYVAVCPGERANNVYVDDPILVRFLTKKYNKYYGQ